MKVRFFTLLGVATPDDAAAKWIKDLVRPFIGQPRNDADDTYRDLMLHLQDSLEFREVRPGADPDRVGLSAQVHVTPSPIGTPLVMAPLHEVAFFLKPTGLVPAMLYVTQGRAGLDVSIQGLPVEIHFPPGMIQPVYDEGEIEDASFNFPDKQLTSDGAPFDPDHPDSVEIWVSETESTRVTVRVNVRLTETNDFLFDTVVPISIGPCKLSGLPCRGLHDIQIIPTPKPRHVDDSHRPPEIALEWARRDITIGELDASTQALITIRTVDFDSFREPLKGWFDKIRAKRDAADPVELVLEDVVLPFRTAPPLPIPTHGRISLRRSVVVADEVAEAYDLHSAPVEFEVRGTLFKIFRMMLQVPAEGESPVAVDIAWTGDSEAEAPEVQGTLSVTDTGEVVIGAPNPLIQTFVKVLGRGVQLSMLKTGVSLAKILDDKDDGFLDVVALLGDFAIVEGEDIERDAFTLRDDAGKPTAMIVQDVGWKFGGPSVGSLYDHDKLRLVLADRLHLTIDELGLVGENNGGMYLMVSASLLMPLGDAAREPTSNDTNATASTDDSKRKGFGVRLHRLRIRFGRHGEHQPRWLLDGISLFYRSSALELTGFGMLSSYDRPPGNHYDEIGIELKARFRALGRELDLGVQYLHGEVQGVDNFNYMIVGATFPGIPIGPVLIKTVRLLFVKNMMPKLEPPDGHEQTMRLFRWFKANGNALDLPLDRKLGAWTPIDDAKAGGIGLTMTIAASDAVRFEGFAFYHEGGGEEGLLVGFEIRFRKAEKPIAFAVADWDFAHDTSGLMVGLSLGLDNVLSKDLPSFLANLAALSGTFFYGNRPPTLAIGQYNDQATWLQFRFGFGSSRLNFSIFVGFCHHRVDDEDPNDPTTERINVWAFMVSLKGGGKIGCLGRLEAYATAVLVFGQWRNEGMASGHQFLFEAGIRCRVFGCFNFGAHVKVDCAVLGPGEPPYHRKSTTFRIETPWYLPDVTFRWENTEGTPVPELMEVVSPPMSDASARRPLGPREATPIGVSRLAGDIGTGPTYALQALRAATTVSPTAADFAALAAVAVDSELMLDLAVSCDASATVLQSTTNTAGGAQESNGLSARYEIVEVGIRRRKRFGDGTWHDLIDPLETRIDGLAGLTDEEIAARFHPAVRFDWDPDLQRLNRVDPRRLVINAVTPYSFATANPEGDEIVADTWPGWPCCTPTKPRDPWHIVEFNDTPAGVRTPAVERFTDSASTLHWVGVPPPVVVPPLVAPAGINVAVMRIGERPEAIIAVASFDEPVAICQVFMYWSAAHSHTQLVVDAFSGLKVVETRTFDMGSQPPPSPIVFTVPGGMTSLTFRKAGDVEPSNPKAPAVELSLIRYRTVREVSELEADRYRCGAQNDAVNGGGRLAWLPNTDYEVTIATRVTLGYKAAGAQDGVITQKAYFRTRGLLGLNATPRLGDEVDPYIESTYPRAGDYLYRREPLAVAFNEAFNTLVPIDHTPTPSDPEERQQLLEWVLAVESIGGERGLERISQTSPDWVVAHRTSPTPPTRPDRWPVVLDDVRHQRGTRHAMTANPYRQRLENMITRPGGCPTPTTLHQSQVLIHQPVDPGVPEPTTARWEADCEYRVNLRQKNAPFIERRPFDPLDAGAFTREAAHGVPVPWTSADGVMRPVAAAADGAMQFAVFGDATGWDHVKVRTVVDPGAGGAGIAVAVSGASAARAICVLVDAAGPTPRLRIVVRRDGVVSEVASATLDAGTIAPFTLEVTSFDDRVRGQVGEVVVETPGDRGDVRSGRVALVSTGDARFLGLDVTGLDAWRSHVRSSRYDDFTAHITSFAGTVHAIEAGAAGPPTANVAALLMRDASAMADAMTAQADAEAREKLCAAWMESLALPLRPRVDRLEITRYLTGNTTDALLLESPEPLPFSRDVQLSIARRSTPLPWPHDHPPLDDVDAFIAHLELDGDHMVGPAPPAALKRLRAIVLASRDGRLGLRYRIYEVLQVRRRGLVTAPGRLLPRNEPLPRGFESIGPGEVGLFDGRGRLLFPPRPLPPPITYVPVRVRVLSNGDETRALVIPTAADPATHAAFGHGTFRLTFSLDRARWRSAVADPASRCTATQALAVSW